MSARLRGAGSLRAEIAAVILLTAVLPAFAVGAWWLGSQYIKSEASLRDRLVINARLNASAFDDYLEGRLAGVKVLAQSVDAGRRDWAALLQSLRGTYPAFVSVLVTDRDGRVLASDPLPPGAPVVRRVVDRAYFQVPRDTGEPYISDGFIGRVQGNDPLVAVSAPLRREGGFDGVVEGSITIDTFARTRGDAQRQRGNDLLITDRGGRVLFATEGLRWRFGQHASRAFFHAIPADGDVLVRDDLLASGATAYAGRARMANGWAVFLVAPQSEFLAPLWRGIALLVGFLVLVALSSLFAARRTGRIVSTAIAQVRESLGDVAHRRTPALREGAAMPRELRPLSESIATLSNELAVADAEQAAALQHQAALADSLRQVVDERDRVIEQRTRELTAAVAELDRQTRTDALTGCLNYRGLSDEVSRLVHAAATDGSPLALLALDIDLFKQFNDRYGHQLGDSALKRFAGAVRSALYRPDDVVSRPGGEEFAVLLPGVELEQAVEIGDRIVASVMAAGIPHADSPTGILTVSIGVAQWLATDGPDARAMMRRADVALYRAKQAGRNRTSI